MQYLRNLITSPAVAALGEIGIDRTVDVELWAQQVSVLEQEQVLSLSDVKKPIVLHIRGSRQDRYGSDANACVREVVREYCGRHQPIHLHCFGSEPSQVRRWLREFPNSHFSFSGQVVHFNDQQVEALRLVPHDRLLIETDSPYLPVQRSLRINTPAYIGDVANEVARLRQESLQTILDITVQNAKRLYCFP